MIIARIGLIDPDSIFVCIGSKRSAKCDSYPSSPLLSGAIACDCATWKRRDNDTAAGGVQPEVSSVVGGVV